MVAHFSQHKIMDMVNKAVAYAVDNPGPEVEKAMVHALRNVAGFRISPHQFGMLKAVAPVVRFHWDMKRKADATDEYRRTLEQIVKDTYDNWR